MNWCGHNSDPLLEVETGGILSSAESIRFLGPGVKSVPALWWQGRLASSPSQRGLISPVQTPSPSRPWPWPQAGAVYGNRAFFLLRARKSRAEF